MSEGMRLFIAEPGGRKGSEAVRMLLSYAVNKMYGIDLPGIEKTARGKPYFPERPDIYFTLSHSKEYVLCAVAGYPVGADVEAERGITPKLHERVCTDDEISSFDFFESWVLKESYIKLFGDFVGGYRDMEFSRNGDIITAPDSRVSAALFPRLGKSFIGACCMGGEMAKEAEFVQIAEYQCGY